MGEFLRAEHLDGVPELHDMRRFVGRPRGDAARGELRSTGAAVVSSRE